LPMPLAAPVTTPRRRCDGGVIRETPLVHLRFDDPGARVSAVLPNSPP
jgi:hypothetical protein